MKLSTKSRYGLRAILEITKKTSSGHSAKRKEISESQTISESYLENILLILKNSHLIKATRGKNGGYILARPASTITLKDIITALEGPLSLVECIDTPSICEKTTACISRTIWKELTDSWYGILEGITLQGLIDREASGFSSPFCI